MEKLLNKKEVAEVLGLSIYTIDRWVMEKKNIPFIRLGSRVLFSEEDVLSYIESQKEYPLGDSPQSERHNSAGSL